MTLRLIEGGGGGGRGGRPFKPHPLADHLWNAIYPSGAVSMDDIAQRMSRSSGIEVGQNYARDVIAHVRNHAYNYEWTIPPVEKGRFGAGRKYIVALVDPNDPETMITEEDDRLLVVQKGTVSSARTIVRMGANVGISLEIFASDPLLSRTEKRQVRAAASMFNAASEMVKEVIARMV